jgi:hypothetical protein
MIDLGVRIEFYETMGPDGVHTGYLGAVVCDEAFRAVAVPAAGDLFAAVSLRMPKSAQAPEVQFTPGVGPFLRVHAVEHYPVPVRDGAAPPWWDSFAEPGVTVVLHTTLGWPLETDGWAGTQLGAFLRGFADAGWSGAFPSNSELFRIWLDITNQQ